ncbi:hypothetical protein MLD38_007851 [Melastoma candidum]|uniref:Uncharacterized protein n=1 Tax=Melastoma candidum TaxID=119954 RepID=A0ACB9RWQ8_9MYRT|nr:hypothetical protein MLD38_007851 [Melastoma candidum]
MTIEGMCSPFRDLRDRVSDRWLPCLLDPVRRSSLGLKLALLSVHVVFVGAVFLLDGDLIEKMLTEPWYPALYLVLFLAALIQYFVTAGSSPGYLTEAWRAFLEANARIKESSASSKPPASLKNENFAVSVYSDQPEKAAHGNASSSWSKMVMLLHPPGTSVRSLTCTYCMLEQPPRSKHCHDCDKCVLQFDHHCVWLGTCIGQNNHCRFWWYICMETALCLWTKVFYITYLQSSISRTWWKDVISIILLCGLSIILIFLLLLLFFHSYLILTNQTTYELVRRRRIPYLRGVPDKVYPFSKGICQNLYKFCCARGGEYYMEQMPTQLELGELARPYTCLDLLTCRCC